MQKPLHDSNRSDIDRRQKRVHRMKVAILTVVTTFLILPSICCIILFLKLNNLQEQLIELKVEMNSDQVEEEIESEEKIEPNETLEPEETLKPEEKLEPKEEEDTLKEESNLTNTSESSINNQDTKEVSANKVEKKLVYLTFDDGPSIHSNEILDILAKYNIKATFFVIGKTDDESKKIYKRIVEEGHTLGMHSYSHIYQSIYSSVEAFANDVSKLQTLLQDITGVKPTIYRFPGGSSNTVSKGRISEFITYLDKKSITYYDWNVANGDAVGIDLSQKELISNVLTGVDKHTKSIVLMHDAASKQKTVQSLSKLIETLQKQDVEFRPIDQTVKPIQQIQ